MEIPSSADFRDIPIPTLPPVDGWKDLPIFTLRAETKEEDLRDVLTLTPVGFFSEYPTIYTDSVYGGEKDSSPYPYQGQRTLNNLAVLDNPLLTMFTRPSVAEGLLAAQAALPSEHYLVVHDAYRPLGVQGELYANYYKDLQEVHPDWTEEQLTAETQKYVSNPSHTQSRPSPHNTGGAIDVAIIRVTPEQNTRIKDLEKMIAALPEDEALRRYELEIEMNAIKKNGTYLNFGTAFDYGGEEASLSYFEELAGQRTLSPTEKEAMRNRRLLYHAMISAGFQAYPFEWWHFNSPKSQMGTKAAGLKEARFGSINLSPDNRAHERMRVLLHELIQEAESTPDSRNPIKWLANKRDPRSRFANIARAVSRNHGRYTQTSFPPAEKISPKTLVYLDLLNLKT